MKQTLILLAISVAMCGILGCGNSYAKFYQHYGVLQKYPLSTQVTIRQYSPEVLASAQVDGAELIGHSRFVDQRAPSERAVEHAKRVGANLLLIDIQYVGTTSETTRVPRHHPGRTVTSTTRNKVFGLTIKKSKTRTQLPGYTTYENVRFTSDKYQHEAYSTNPNKNQHQHHSKLPRTTTTH